MDPTSPFRDPNNSHGNIVFNWRARPLEELLPFAMGYRRAGAQLANRIAAAPSLADYDGYPIFFLYRHAVELNLKAVILKAAGLASLEADDAAGPRPDLGFIWRQHSIKALFKVARKVFREIEGVLPGAASFLDEHESVLLDLEALDPGSYTFRYPVDTKARATFPRHTIVNVLVFAERLDAVCSALEGAYTGLHETFQASAELKYEIQELLKEL